MLHEAEIKKQRTFKVFQVNGPEQRRGRKIMRHQQAGWNRWRKMQKEKEQKSSPWKDYEAKTTSDQNQQTPASDLQKKTSQFSLRLLGNILQTEQRKSGTNSKLRPVKIAIICFVKHGGGIVMVWDCFAISGQNKLLWLMKP